MTSAAVSMDFAIGCVDEMPDWAEGAMSVPCRQPCEANEDCKQYIQHCTVLICSQEKHLMHEFSLHAIVNRIRKGRQIGRQA